ncbi:TIGR04376 family protein [Cyanobacterium aponinum UTEX 3222]|uniref:TIGR04376 family protein n=1 Tax=Cyanobacterium aponinum 0216 TaxID=2676140 RepID=A0A844GTT2_9CHRO|nr:TIGR04376 family protein [Cyanobacterium aponinum]MTF38983.1 TIGR04376 family protein [Cyanobacterium aponinum 0216]WRL37729.1 TIGR04376 family protein [Cyanobacterium aponinum UTEX 3221]WRL41798.1 TIGR04376 family protein [Cyanobacterium aponinum UTEX 3222]
MSIFENFTNFLESKLDEFLQSNPELNLTIIAQEIKQEKEDTIGLINKLESRRKQLELDILKLVQDIKIWCERIEKAEKANRNDLAREAEERKNTLLSQGNFAWQEMEKVKNQILENNSKLINLENKEREINLKVKELEKAKQWTQSNSNTSNYNSYGSYRNSGFNNSNDDLEKKFRDWEVSVELEELKKKMS